ncbi:MAG: hypothetical protein ACREEY_05255 [Brevundimonas sp.]
MLRYLGCAILGAPVVMLATIASAQVAPAPELSGLPGTTLPVAPTTSSPAPGASQPVSQALSLDELEHENGRQGVYVYANTTQALTATNSGNTITADHVGSGNISLTEGAFAGFAGIGNFVINSGHNNNLQGSLSIMIVSP